MRAVTSENLKKLFPRSIRFLVRENFLWLLFYAAVIVSSWYLRDEQSSVRMSIDDILLGLFIGSSIVVVARLFRSLLLRFCFSFECVDDRLLISNGIFLRKREEIFLDKIIDVYTTKDWSDFVLGLSSVGLVLIGRKDLVISGYSRKVARDLQEHIIFLIEKSKRQRPEDEERTLPVVDEVQAASAR